MEVQTQTIAEAGLDQEAANEALIDQGFVPMAPLTAAPAAWVEKTVYPAGALVSEGGQVYRSQVAGNKEHKPSEDADFANWAPVSVSVIPLVNPNYNHLQSAGAGLGE